MILQVARPLTVGTAVWNSAESVEPPDLRSNDREAPPPDLVALTGPVPTQSILLIQDHSGAARWSA